MKKWLTLLLTAPALLLVAKADDLSAKYASQGRLIMTQFASAPFPHTNRAAGYRYQDTLYSAKEHYDDNTVGVFIPANFRPGASLSVVVHFHGWRNHVARVFEQYRLIEQFVASGRNAVLVVPQGPRDAPDSSGGKLEDQDGFKRFIQELAGLLRQQELLKQKPFEIGDVILSGHSGGYKVIASILDRGGLAEHVKEVWLFDALYGRTDSFLNWFDSSHGRLIDIYTEDGGTKVETERLIKTLSARGTPYFAGKEAAIRTADLKSNRGIFIYTALPHNDVVAKHETFRQFLETSCLPSISLEKPERNFKTEK